jgi:hypothetical protein
VRLRLTVREFEREDEATQHRAGDDGNHGRGGNYRRGQPRERIDGFTAHGIERRSSSRLAITVVVAIAVTATAS